MKEYNPTPRVAAILNRGLAAVHSVPYTVSARWVFYRLIQDGSIRGKSSYKTFLKWTSRARKGFWNGWRPNTITDEGREVSMRGGGHESEEDWIEYMRTQQPLIRSWDRQDNILIVLYEAAAMSSQFRYCIGDLRVSMAPFKGDASIPHKWNIAEHLTIRHQQFPDKPVVVLYFGDLDDKGLEIPENGMRDIWQWVELEGVDTTLQKVSEWEWATNCGGFRWIRCGLLPEQVEDFSIPADPERPGAYQWEALDDAQARDLILNNVLRFWDRAIVEEVEDEESEIGERWTQRLDLIL